MLAETDLRVRGCDYGWCVFQAETALCGGEVAPNEAGRSPSVCAKCSNFAADDRHVGYWQDRRRRNLALWDRASPLARAVLAAAVMAAPLAVAARLLGHTHSHVAVLGGAVAACLVAGGSYVGVQLLLRAPEASWLLGALLRRPAPALGTEVGR